MATPFDAELANYEQSTSAPPDDDFDDAHAQSLRDAENGRVSGVYAPSGPRFEAVDLTQEIPPTNYLVETLDLCAGAPAMLAGLGYAGKTVAAQQMAIDLVTGRPIWGEFKARAGARVLHIDREQGRAVTVKRYQRIGAAAGIDLRAVAERLRVVIHPPLVFESPAAEAVLVREAEGFDLVVIDSWRAACPSLDENSSEARAPLDMTGRVSEKTGAAFLWIHHARKPQKDAPGGTKASIRGSGAFFDACSSVLCLSADKGEATFVEHQKARSSGRPAADFYLAIEDVAVGGDKLGGLRVAHRSLDEAKPRAEPGKLHEAVMQRIRHHLAKHPDVAGKEALHARMGGNKGEFNAAYKELSATGEIVNLGTYHAPRLRLKVAVNS
ncbi:MAG: AAA family ATPase [Deltaproteobacteria bacterium]|nr:AAA family ATPase [Deltaproteobacteria bacterium]